MEWVDWNMILSVAIGAFFGAFFAGVVNWVIEMITRRLDIKHGRYNHPPTKWGIGMPKGPWTPWDIFK